MNDQFSGSLCFVSVGCLFISSFPCLVMLCELILISSICA